MSRHLVLHILTRLLVPLILLFALYVQFHGDFGPGGGFQAGVIFATGFILYGLVFGLESAQRVVPPAVTRALGAAGVLLYVATGLAPILLGANFLDYSVLAADVVHGQEIGIFLVELGVGVTVAAVMIGLFYAFAGWEEGES